MNVMYVDAVSYQYYYNIYYSCFVYCQFCLPCLKQLVVYTVVYNIKHGQMLCNNVYVPLLLRLSNDVEENPGPTIFYEIIDPRETLCADFSQGDIRFGQNAGKQCVAMSVTSSYNKV